MILLLLFSLLYSVAALQPRVLVVTPLHVSQLEEQRFRDFARCLFAKPASKTASFDVLLVISGGGASEAARVRGPGLARIVAEALDEATAKEKRDETATAAEETSTAASSLPRRTIAVDFLELPAERDGYSSVENSFAGPNEVFFDTFLGREEEEREEEETTPTKRATTTPTERATSSIFERHVKRYPLVLQLESDVCATGEGWLDAALEPLVGVAFGGEGGERGSVSEAAARVAEASSPLRAKNDDDDDGDRLPPSRLPAVVGATLGGRCVHVSAPPKHCSPLERQPRHSRSHINGNALYLPSSPRFVELAETARALAGDGDVLPFDLALWAAEQLLLSDDDGDDDEGAEGDERDERKEGRLPKAPPPPPPARYLVRNPRMVNLGRHVEGSRIEESAYHGGRDGETLLVHAPRRLRVDSPLDVALEASVPSPLPFSPPLAVVVVPRVRSEGERAMEEAASLVAHAAESLSSPPSASLSSSSAPSFSGSPVFVALDRRGFEAASRAAPYSVLDAFDFYSPSREDERSPPSPLEDAAAVAAVAALLSRRVNDGGSSRGLLLLSSPAVAAVGPFDETLLRFQEEEREGARGRDSPPTLLVLPPSPRSSPSPALPPMLWVPPGSDKVPLALSAWSVALSKEAEREKESEGGETTTTTTTTSPLSLLLRAASSSRVAVGRLPACVFARSKAWKRARSLRRRRKSRRRSRNSEEREREREETLLRLSTPASAATASVQLVSFQEEEDAREGLIEAGLWKGDERRR